MTVRMPLIATFDAQLPSCVLSSLPYWRLFAPLTRQIPRYVIPTLYGARNTRRVPWTQQPQIATLPGIGAPALLWNASLPSSNLTPGSASGAVTATRRLGASGIYQDCLATGAKVQFPFITSLSTATKWTIYFRANWANSGLNYQTILSLNGVLIIRVAIEDANTLQLVYWNVGAGQVQRHRTAQGTTESGADYAFVFDESAGRTEIWRNGVNIYTTGVNWFASSRTTPAGIAIGDDDAGAANTFLNGGIQYTAVYLEAHSTTQIASVQANPWQLFAPLMRQQYFLDSTGGLVYYPIFYLRA
jgi:hypothetical protein